MPGIHGIDVSQFQGNINWAAVKAAGEVFVIAKATEGYGEDDPDYVQNYHGAKNQGLYFGAYHYLWASLPAQRQLDHFCSRLFAFSDGDLPPALDVEETKGMSAQAVIDHIAFFRDGIKSRFGCDMVIYTYPDFWMNILGNPTEFAGTNPLWFARYGSATPNPLPGGWNTLTIWQYDDHGNVPGVGNVDMDLFEGSIDQLRALAFEGGKWGGAVNPPPVPPQPPTPQPSLVFPTGFSFGGSFLKFWQSLGPLAVRVLGYPISPEMKLILEDGVERTVQFTERARLEWHPEWQKPSPDDVGLGRLGADELARVKAGQK